MSALRPIKSKDQYMEYLKELAELAARSDSDLSEKAKERASHLSILLEAYEAKVENLHAPDPISAIRLRMHERQLTPNDVVPYFGSRSRVSEVLNGRRPLTLGMIRKISPALNIPADFLIADNVAEPNSEEPDWARFPVAEMYKRGWIRSKTVRSASLVEEMKKFFEPIDSRELLASYRKSITLRSDSMTSDYARAAWLARVVTVAKLSKDDYPLFSAENLSAEVLSNIASFSQRSDGPARAFSLLKTLGIIVVYEPSLKSAYVDGAAARIDDTPVIGLALRYGRIDYFWFTLMHEIAHVWKHLSGEQYLLDDFDASYEDNPLEAEANRIARDALIPRLEWRRSVASRSPSVESIMTLARKIGRDPAIIAGRVRKESGNYAVFSELVGSGEIREGIRKGVQS